MRRLARRLFTLCSALSLLLSVAVCVLWVRSVRNGDRFERSGHPFALISKHGRLVIVGPPPPPKSAAARTAPNDLIGSLRNDQVAWVADLYSGPDGYHIAGLPKAKPRPSSAAEALWKAASTPDVERPLLRALGDP